MDGRAQALGPCCLPGTLAATDGKPSSQDLNQCFDTRCCVLSSSLSSWVKSFAPVLLLKSKKAKKKKKTYLKLTWKADWQRDKEKERMGGERERKTSFTYWLTSQMAQQLGLGLVEARSSCRVSHALSHHLLPLWCVSRKLDHKQSSRDSYWCWGFKAVGLKAGSASCIIMPHNPLCTTVSQYFCLLL